ncbi:MAG: hypothetical protein ACTS4T_00700 [Candidatus Hodgkinia cicadicola]
MGEFAWAEVSNGWTAEDRGLRNYRTATRPKLNGITQTDAEVNECLNLKDGRKLQSAVC